MTTEATNYFERDPQFQALADAIKDAEDAGGLVLRREPPVGFGARQVTQQIRENVEASRKLGRSADAHMTRAANGLRAAAAAPASALEEKEQRHA